MNEYYGPDEERLSLDPRLEENLRAAVRHHAIQSALWLAGGLVALAVIIVAPLLWPMRSAWWLVEIPLGGVAWGLFAYHRSAAKILDHLMSAAWMQQHEGDLAPRVYGIMGFRLRL